MCNVLFLFGAGASYGAGGILPGRPPLGSNLFKDLSTVYPGTWGSLPSAIKERFKNGNFEEGMGLIYKHLGTAIPELMRQMAIYFIQFRPISDSSLYCSLIEDLADSIKLNEVLFSTLNYDCVLEFSLLSKGHRITYFDEGKDGEIPVWKLHGSCNFFSIGVQAGPGISYDTSIVWEGGIQAFLDSNRVIEHCLVETGLAPIMSLYMEGKPLNVSPSAIIELQSNWSDRVYNCSAVFLIGVRPWPNDEHIWKPLAETHSPIYFVGGFDEFDNWNSKFRQDFSEYLGGRFNTGYRKLIERINAL